MQNSENVPVTLLIDWRTAVAQWPPDVEPAFA